MASEKITEEWINLFSENTSIEGKVVLRDRTRFHGRLKGEIIAETGTTVILAESSAVDGQIKGDILFIDGYVKGDIYAKTSVRISGTGRIVGNIHSPSIKIEFGAYFNGKSKMETQDFKTSPAPSPT